jgi:hypothetical protein
MPVRLKVNADIELLGGCMHVFEAGGCENGLHPHLPDPLGGPAVGIHGLHDAQGHLQRTLPVLLVDLGYQV